MTDAAPTIAVLGATSQIARDYIGRAAVTDARLALYARDPARVDAWLAGQGLAGRFEVASLECFADGEHAAVLNFIGVGDPARAVAMGAGIFDATRRWDDAVLGYLARSPATRYIFLSSGAVYGDAFDAPVTRDSAARFPVNALGAQHWYGLAKLAAEAGHRAEAGRSIIDLRVFNYISGTADIAARFLVTDCARAIRDGQVFATTEQDMVRDYLGPDDFHRLVAACLAAPAGTNAAADAHTRAPIAKAALLELLASGFGLDYRYTGTGGAVNATGAKPHYHSLDRTAGDWGYAPALDSAATLRIEVAALLGRAVPPPKGRC